MRCFKFHVRAIFIKLSLDCQRNIAAISLFFHLAVKIGTANVARIYNLIFSTRFISQSSAMYMLAGSCKNADLMKIARYSLRTADLIICLAVVRITGLHQIRAPISDDPYRCYLIIIIERNTLFLKQR